MKKSMLFMFIFMIILSNLASANSFDTKFVLGENISIEQEVPGNIYVFSTKASVLDSINGDFVVASGTTSIQAPIYEDVLIVSGEVFIDADVGGDTRIVAGNIVINANIFGDLVAAGGNIRISNQSTVGKDAFLTGGTVVVDGVVDGNLAITAARIILNGVVLGDAKFESGEILIGDNAQIIGNVNIIGSGKIDEEKVGGEVRHTIIQKEQSNSIWPQILGFLTFFIYLFVGGLIFLLFAGKYYDKASSMIYERPVLSFFIGLLIFILVPIIIGLFFVTLLGIPLGILFMVVFSLALLLSFIVGAFFTGKIIYVNKTRNKSKNLIIFIGSLIVVLLLLVPILGFLYLVYLLFAGMGSLVLGLLLGEKKKELTVQKKKDVQKKEFKKKVVKKSGSEKSF